MLNDLAGESVCVQAGLSVAEQVGADLAGVAAAPVVALDLIESGQGRAIAAGWSLWQDAVAAWRARDLDGS